MMVREGGAAVLVIAGLVHLVGGGFFPPSCPPQCTCEPPEKPRTFSCRGDTLPSLNPQITSLVIHDATITMLTPTLTTSLQHLVELSLEGVGLAGLEAGALGRMERLGSLAITHNPLTTLTAGTFLNCSSLISLNLDNNNIQVVEDNTFAPLGSLVNLSLAHNTLLQPPARLPAGLRSLSLNHNPLEALSAPLDLPNLQHLNLCHTNLSSIPPDMLEVREVRWLCLGGPGLNITHRLFTPAKFPQLQSLRLQGSPPQWLILDHGAQNTIKALTTSSLHTLELEGCRIPSFELLSGRNSQLRSLGLRDVESDTPILRAARVGLPEVAVMDLSGSPVLAKLLLSNPGRLPQLRELRVARCGLTSFTNNFVEQRAPQLERLDLSNNPLECTCYGFSWLRPLVGNGELHLLQEENTTCAIPQHLQGRPVLTATLCPPLPAATTTAPPPTPEPQTEPSLVLRQGKGGSIEESQTEGPGAEEPETEGSGREGVGTEKPEAKGLGTQGLEAEGPNRQYMWLIIVFGVAGCVVVVVVLFLLGAWTYRCYRSCRRGQLVFRHNYGHSSSSIRTDSVVIMRNTNDNVGEAGFVNEM